MVKLHYLPILTSAWFLVTVISTYFIATLSGHVYYYFPYISDTGTSPPESCIFGLLLNLGAILLLSTLYIRYRQVENDIKIKNIRLNPRWNSTGSVLGVISCLGVSVVGNFSETDSPTVHLIGTQMIFAVGSCLFYIQTRISYAYLSANHRRITRLMFCMRVLLASLLLPQLICVLYYGYVANTEFTGATMLWWTEDIGGFTHRLTSTFLEWTLAICVFVYIVTFTNEFKYIQFEEVMLNYKL